MKQKIITYTFSAAAKTITFSDYGSITLESVLAVINATDQITIFNPTNTSLGGTVATNVLTLEYDTTSMADTDKLIIYYDDNTAQPISGTLTANLSATDNAVLDAIEVDTTAIAGAVSGTEMQVDVITMPTVAVTGTFWQATQPVSLASVPSH